VRLSCDTAMSGKESGLQTKVKAYLKSQDCFVMVIQPQAGIPSGTSDIFFCKEGFYGFIELKATKKSPFQPLQKEFVAKMNRWSWAKVVYPEIWEETKAELKKII
jgi:hypothetical protein